MDGLSPVEAKVLEERAQIDLLQELAGAVLAMVPLDTQHKLAAKGQAWIDAVRARDEAEERARERWLKARGVGVKEKSE